MYKVKVHQMFKSHPACCPGWKILQEKKWTPFWWRRKKRGWRLRRFFSAEKRLSKVCKLKHHSFLYSGDFSSVLCFHKLLRKWAEHVANKIFSTSNSIYSIITLHLRELSGGKSPLRFFTYFKIYDKELNKYTLGRNKRAIVADGSPQGRKPRPANPGTDRSKLAINGPSKHRSSSLEPRRGELKNLWMNDTQGGGVRRQRRP